jgi:hypothetical protein
MLFALIGWTQPALANDAHYGATIRKDNGNIFVMLLITDFKTRYELHYGTFIPSGSLKAHAAGSLNMEKVAGKIESAGDQLFRMKAADQGSCDYNKRSFASYPLTVDKNKPFPGKVSVHKSLFKKLFGTSISDAQLTFTQVKSDYADAANLYDQWLAPKNEAPSEDLRVSHGCIEWDDNGLYFVPSAKAGV